MFALLLRFLMIRYNGHSTIYFLFYPIIQSRCHPKLFSFVLPTLNLGTIDVCTDDRGLSHKHNVWKTIFIKRFFDIS